jgi:protein involved in polysaccharide export with SLBB domain
MLGIAIGFTLNLRVWQLLVGPANEARMSSLPTYAIEPPDVLSIDVSGDAAASLRGVPGKHLVGPDGMVYLGTLGPVYVAGKTITEAQTAIGNAVAKQTASAQVLVDVFAYNSKKYYVIIQGPGNSANVVEAPITGNETVLDAIARIGGLQASPSTQIWISRPARGQQRILPIDWTAVASGASTVTNFQLMPGDRLFVSPKMGGSATN